MVQQHTFFLWCSLVHVYFEILPSTVIILELGWLLIRDSIFSFPSVGLLFEQPTINITTLVIIVVVVALAQVLAQAPLWTSAFQSGSDNIWLAPLTLPIITGYVGMSFVVRGIKVNISQWRIDKSVVYHLQRA